MQFGLGNHANPRSGRSGLCSQLSAGILRTAVDQVQGIGMPRPGRPVGRAGMRQQPVQHDQRCRAAPRAPPARCPATAWRRACSVTRRSPARWKRWRSGPRWPPGSAIRQPLSRSASSRAIQKPVTVDGPRVQVGRVLVPADLAADMRLLEEVHRLQQQRLAEAQRPRQLGQARLARDAVEDGIEIVQRMADLVQRQRHRLVGRLLLEEEADGAAQFLEIAVAGMALVARREDRARRPGSKPATSSAARACRASQSAAGRNPSSTRKPSRA